VCIPQITKLDTETGETILFTEDKLYTADPVFIPTPGASVSPNIYINIYLT